MTDGILLPHNVFRVQSRLYDNTIPVFFEENFTNICMCNNAAHTRYLEGNPVVGGATKHALTMARIQGYVVLGQRNQNVLQMNNSAV
jgi:hypothetical protein